jgi:hypothetical protein
MAKIALVTGGSRGLGKNMTDRGPEELFNHASENDWSGSGHLAYTDGFYTRLLIALV